MLCTAMYWLFYIYKPQSVIIAPLFLPHLSTKYGNFVSFTCPCFPDFKTKLDNFYASHCHIFFIWKQNMLVCKHHRDVFLSFPNEIRCFVSLIQLFLYTTVCVISEWDHINGLQALYNHAHIIFKKIQQCKKLCTVVFSFF